jgi:hypothetical protein
MSETTGVKARWVELGQMDRAALRVEWAGAFGDAPPHYLSMNFMRKALIWHAQNQHFGGLKADVKRALNAAANGKAVRSQASQIAPGTQLVREWNGRRYLVDVFENGFRMNGEDFRSLSAIALRITGTSWSGPRFFGLTDRQGAGQ